MNNFKKHTSSALHALIIAGLFNYCSVKHELTLFIFMALLTGIMVTSWKYVFHQQPRGFILSIGGYGMLFAALSLYFTALYFGIALNIDIDEVLRLYWNRAPLLFIMPFVIIPLNLFVWCQWFNAPQHIDATTPTSLTTRLR